MAGYLDSRKLTNVKGRIKYITNKDKQENIVDYFNTADNEFWKMLAKENQERHRQVKAGGKCCEARELIIGIPQNATITAEQICNTFKNKYGVECSCAIHQNNKKGIINKHCHLIFSERVKLDIPEIVAEKRAARTYYYDEKGNKCKKAEAVKTVKKGTILQKGSIRFFSDKNEHFKTQKFIYECKELFLKNLLQIDWSLRAEKQNKELSEKHIGKNNPKAEYIKQNNKLKSMLKNVCNASDFIFEQEKGYALEDFKKGYGVKNFSIRNFEENEYKVYRFVEETQVRYKQRVKDEVNQHNHVNKDISCLEDNRSNYVMKKVQDIIIEDYEPETKTKDKPKVIEFLKNKISNMFERIKKLVSLQDDLYIEPKNKIEIIQNSRDHSLEIKDESYFKEQKQIERDDFDLEM